MYPTPDRLRAIRPMIRANLDPNTCSGWGLIHDKRPMHGRLRCITSIRDALNAVQAVGKWRADRWLAGLRILLYHAEDPGGKPGGDSSIYRRSRWVAMTAVDQARDIVLNSAGAERSVQLLQRGGANSRLRFQIAGSTI